MGRVKKAIINTTGENTYRTATDWQIEVVTPSHPFKFCKLLYHVSGIYNRKNKTYIRSMSLYQLNTSMTKGRRVDKQDT